MPRFAAEQVSRALVGRTVAEVERDLILETLKHCLGNRTHAANVLGISIRTLRNKLNEYAADGVPVPPPGGGAARRGVAQPLFRGVRRARPGMTETTSPPQPPRRSWSRPRRRRSRRNAAALLYSSEVKQATPCSKVGNSITTKR